MKKLVTLAFLIVAAFSLHAQSMFQAPAVMAFEAEGSGKAKWELTNHDFGEVAQGTKLNYRFEITNVGNKPIKIETVKPSCGCTATNYTKEEIKPGETGFVEAGYESTGAGVFTKSITVKTSDSETPTILTFRGVSVAPEK